MTSREDCEKWVDENWHRFRNRTEEIPIAEVLHEFSKTTIGHFPPPTLEELVKADIKDKLDEATDAAWLKQLSENHRQMFMAEEESQKRTRAKDLIWSEDAGCWLKPIPAEEEKQKGSL